MSPHGTPPWGNVGPKSTTYGLDDMGELAARLGSPVKWDRRGDLIYACTFESGLGFGSIYGSGDAHAEFLSPRYPREGGVGLCLYPGSGGSGYAAVVFSLPRPPVSKIGVEYSFSVHTDVSTWVINSSWYSGTQLLKAKIQIDHANGDLDYWTAAGAWAEFADDLNLRGGSSPVHTAKLVVDYNAQVYTRFIIDHRSWDLSAYAIRATDSGTSSSFTTDFRVTPVTGALQYHYADNFLFTQNEP